MPHLNSKQSDRACGPPLMPHPYSIFSQLASSPYTSLHPMALKRLFEEEYYLKSLFSRKSSNLFSAALSERLKTDMARDLFPLADKLQLDLASRQNALGANASGGLVRCPSTTLSPTPSSPCLLVQPSSHLDTNNNSITTSRSLCWLLSLPLH